MTLWCNQEGESRACIHVASSYSGEGWRAQCHSRVYSIVALAIHRAGRVKHGIRVALRECRVRCYETEGINIGKCSMDGKGAVPLASTPAGML
jgi:hypothetical protein